MRPGVAVAAAAVFLAACGDSTPASLVFVEISPAQPKIGDIVTVKFAAVDSRGLPAEGVPVTFRLQQERPDVSLNPVEASTTKGGGEVTTQVVASSRVTSVVVVAQAGARIAQSPPISVAGAEVSERGITFQCGELSGEGSGGGYALGAYGPARNLIAGVKMNCNAHVSDRNGDGIAGALVSFLAEAGTIGPSAESVTDAVGNAKVLYKTSLPLPQDVPPGRYVHPTPVTNADLLKIDQPLAPAWMYPWMWRSNPMLDPIPATADCVGGCPEPERPDPVRPGKINNPRDNLVTLIAVTAGEESYIDANNNGRYDEGETFIDTVEPFVDANDSGTYEAGELYVDTNGDGAWTGKNGQHDSNTLIWAQERILWTGLPLAPYDYQGALGGGTYYTVGVINTVSGSLDIPHFGSQVAQFRFADPWYNTPAQNGDNDGCSAVASPAVVVFPEAFGGTGHLLAYPGVLGANFTIMDAHAPTTLEDGGTGEVPAPGATYHVQVICKFTNSRIEGSVVTIEMAAVSGRVR